MKVSFNDERMLKIFETCVELNAECVILSFREDGLLISTTDQVGQAMISAFIHKKAFDMYNIKKENSFIVDLKKAKKTKFFSKKKDNSVIISVEEDIFKISYIDNTTIISNKNYLVSGKIDDLFEPEDIESGTVIFMSIDKICDWLKMIKSSDEYVGVNVRYDSLKLYSLTPKVSEEDVIIEEMFEGSENIRTKNISKDPDIMEDGVMCFNVDVLLMLISKFSGVFDEIKISILYNEPFFGWMKDDEGNFLVSVTLAPRMEN